jgi:hypothetical protein
LAYQPPASSTFLSEQTSHQQPASSTFLSEQTSINHQPPAKRTAEGTSTRNPSDTLEPKQLDHALHWVFYILAAFM